MASPLSTPSPVEIRLSDLLSLSVPVQWHEAVAVVRQVGLMVSGVRDRPGWGAPQPTTVEVDHGAPADPASLQWPPPAEDLAGLEYVHVDGVVPDASGIWLNPDGGVRLDPSVGGTPRTVAGLSALLHSLLPAGAPGQLVVLGNAEKPFVGETATKEFLDALTFFARPDDFREVQALVARALDMRVTNERAAALHALTERARHQPPDPAPAPVRPRKNMTYKRLPLITAGLSLLVLLVAGGCWWTRDSAVAAPDPAGPTPASPTVAQRVQSTVASAATAVRQVFGDTPAAEAPGTRDIVLPARGRSARRRPEPTPAPPVVVNAPPVARSRADGAAGAPAVTPAAPVASVPEPDTSGRVFTAADASVTPPVLTRAQMPEVPPAGQPDTRRGVMEVLVGEDGQVLTVRLLSPVARHQERMMLSAAKTWRFTPATRDGRPVRYRLRMPITW